MGRNGETLADFCNHPAAATAKLTPGNIASVRIYSTAAYKVLNNPFRDRESSEPHPFPVTIALLAAAIAKLRAVGAQEEHAHKEVDLWRGMRDGAHPDFHD